MLDLSVLLAKAEAVPGTAVVPAIATDQMLIGNLVVTPFNSTALRRDIDLPYPGARPAIPTAIHGAQTFDVELAGSGAAATPAFWSVLLNMCLFGAPVPTAGAGAQVAYPLASAGDGGSNTLYGFKDSVGQRLFGARSNVVFDFTEKQLPKMSFSALGLILNNAPIVAGAPGVSSLPTPPAPVEVNNLNTALVVDGYTLGAQSAKIDMGMKTALYSTTGGRAIVFDKSADADRRGAKVTIVAELPDPAAQNYFPKIVLGTGVALSLTHGTVAGNIVQVAAPNLVNTGITFSAVNNRVFMTMTGDLVPTAAGNEMTLVTK